MSRLEKGFSLVELVVAASILVVGLIVVLRSFLSVSSAVDSAQNRIRACAYLDRQMTGLEFSYRTQEFPEDNSIEAQVLLGKRKAIFSQGFHNS